MLLGFLGVFLVSFIEGNIYKKINIQDNRNFISGILAIISALSLFIYSYTTGVKEGDYNFFFEPWIYILIVLESLGAYLYREAYYHYHNKYTIVNMFMFSTVYLMPLYAYFMNQIIPMNHDISILNNFKDSLIASLMLFLGSYIYFKGKFKSQEIHKPLILILLAGNMLNCFYFSLKGIQTYNGTLMYSFVIFIIGINFFILSLQKKERFRLNKPQAKDLSWIFVIKAFFHLLYIKAVAYVPVEIGPIVRRVSQLGSGLIIDKKLLSRNETIGILIILGVFIYLVLKTMN